MNNNYNSNVCLKLKKLDNIYFNRSAITYYIINQRIKIIEYCLKYKTLQLK